MYFMRITAILYLRKYYTILHITRGFEIENTSHNTNH